MDDKVDVTGCLEKIFCLKKTILELEDLVAKKYAEADDEDIPSVLEKCEMLIDELQKNAAVFKGDFHKVFNRNSHSNNSLESAKTSNLERLLTTPDLFGNDRTEEENSLNSESINDDQDNEEEKSRNRSHKTGKKKTEKNRNSSPDSTQRSTKSPRLRAKAVAEKENGDDMESSHSKGTKDEDSTEKPENGTDESKEAPTPKKNYIKVRDIKQLVSPTTETDDMSSTPQPKKKTVTFDTSVIILSSEDEGGKTKKSGKTRTEKLKDETEAVQDSSDSENEKENRKRSKTKSLRKRRSHNSDSPVEDSDDGASKRRTKRSCAEESSKKRTKEKPSKSSNRKRVIVISDESSDEGNSSEEESAIASSSKKDTSKTKQSKKSSKRPLRIKIDDLTKKVNLKVADSNDELSLDEHDSPKSKHRTKHMSTSNRLHRSLVDWKDDVKFSSEAYVSLIRYPCENLKKYYQERRELLSIKRLTNLSSLKRKRDTRNRSPSSKKSSSDSDKPQSKKRHTKKEKADTSKVSSDSDDELMSKRKDVYIPLEPIPVEKLLPDKNFDEKEAMASLVMDKLRDKLGEADENYIVENDEAVGKEKSRKKKKNKDKEIKDSEMKDADAEPINKKKPGDLNDENDELSMSVDENLEETNVNGSNTELNDEDEDKNNQSEKGEQREQNEEENMSCNKTEKSGEEEDYLPEKQADTKDKKNDVDENPASELNDSAIENTEQNRQTEEPSEDSPDKSKSKSEVKKKKTESDGKSDSDEEGNSESEDIKKKKTTSDEHQKDVEDDKSESESYVKEKKTKSGEKSDDDEADKSECESDVEKRKKKSDGKGTDDGDESESESENVKKKKTKSDGKCKDSEDDKSESANSKKKNNSDEKSRDDDDVNSESESENAKKRTKSDGDHKDDEEIGSEFESENIKKKKTKSHGDHKDGEEDDSGSDSENIKEKKTKSDKHTNDEVESESESENAKKKKTKSDHEENDSESESGSVKNKKTKQDGNHTDDGDESESENVKRKKTKPARDHEENEGDESESESENARKKKAKSDAKCKDGDESESESEDFKKKQTNSNGKCKDDEKDKGSSDDHSDSDSEGTKKRDKRGEKKTKRKVDSDHESSNDQQESDGDGDNRDSKTKDSDSDKSSNEQKENGKSSDSDESDSDKKKNKNWRRDKLLTIKISSTDSEEDFSKYCKKKEKSKKKLMRKVKKRACIVVSDSGSEDWQKSDKSSSDSSSSDSDKDKPKEEKNNNKKGAGRKRIKSLKESSSDEDGEKSTRKNIRRVWGKDSLAESTKKAEAEEKERKARILEKQKKYNSMFAIPQQTAAKLEKLVLDFNDETEEELLKVDVNLVEKLKPHQASGIQFMWDACFESIERAKKTKGSGCILAHCMGLGKTLQVVAFTHTLLVNEEKTGVKKVLVVCPVNTVLNWKAEYKKWLPDEDDFEVYELSSCRPNERQYEVKNWNNTGGIMIIGYSMFRLLTNPDNKKVNKKTRDLFQNALVDPGPDLVVCDEGHLLKNEKSHLSIAMNRIKTARRIVLTGTPLQNNLKEYFCMVQFIKPNLLGTYKEYLNRFVNPITNGQYTDSTPHDIQIMRKRSHVLHKLLDGVVQRKDYSVLAPYLPQKNEYVLFLSLTDVQIKLYEHYLNNFARRSNSGSSKNTSFLFVDFQELQGICSHPRVLVDRKIHKDHKEMFADDDEEESEGSLKDFIDDKEETTSTSDSSSEAEGSDKSDDEEEEKPKKGPKKRLTRAAAKADGVIDLDSIRDEKTTGWWTQYCSSDELENIHNSTKLALLFNILKESEQIGDKVLIFSQSLYSLSVIEYFLEKIDEATQDGNDVGGFTGSWALGLDYFRLDGSSSCDSRASWCNTFNDPQNTRARLFLISTRAGGLGINLVAANRVIIFDVSWNPSHDIQSIYRVYRFGQTKPCYIYRFVTYGAMEMKIYERQVTKQAISKRVIDEQQIDRHYNQNDLAELYKFEPRMEVRETPLVPKDVLLGELLQKFDNEILSYHEHQSLLENKEDEELDEEERKAAWEEFENEKVLRRTYNTGANPGGVAMTPQAVTAALTNIVRRDNPTWNDQQIKAMLPTLVKELEQQVQSGVMTMYQRIQREIQIMNAAQEKKMREAWMQQQMMLYHQQQQQAIINDLSLTPEQRKVRLNQLLYNQWRAFNNAGISNNVAPLMNNVIRPNNNPLEVIDLND